MAWQRNGRTGESGEQGEPVTRLSLSIISINYAFLLELFEG
jgi:hypothetical protein